jgi:tetratricopeptide (TPR) repeat protein
MKISRDKILIPTIKSGLKALKQNQPLTFMLLMVCLSLSTTVTYSQDEPLSLENIEIPQVRLPLCFGLSGISELRALAVCEALNLNQTVKARELSEQWLRAEPNSPAAQFSLAEVLFSVEGNMPRALFHLNRAEELTNYQFVGDALQSGQMEWHYLTLSQLSYVHQLMGNQISSLEYLDKLNTIYGQEVESFRGWPLIKLKQYDAARASANSVLQSSDNQRERSRAWNTLCAVELASLQPLESMTACNRSISEDEDIENPANDYDTVYLSNASEVSLSLLQIDQAEKYLDRATRFLNPQSVADPWIYKLYLTLNQSRFDEARDSLDRMLIWRESQDPIVSVMNRAEHFLVSASFLLIAGYAEDSIKLTTTALNQPDRNGSYSADAAQKDSFAALLNMMANQTEFQIQLENNASNNFLDSIFTRLNLTSLQLDSWRAARRAAALFADFEVLQNRLRPYSPLDVHIPEWIEPEIISLIGTGVMSNILEQAYENGAFQLNTGYYNSYKAEIAALEGKNLEVLSHGESALRLLPQEEGLLRARIAARMASAARAQGNYEEALIYYETTLKQDPSIIRRLAEDLPVLIISDGSDFSNLLKNYISRSPRFTADENGLVLEISSTPDFSICLKSRNGNIISCYNAAAVNNQDSKSNARQLTRLFHSNTFGLGFDISKAQRSVLLGSSVILRSQTDGSMQADRNTFKAR